MSGIAVVAQGHGVLNSPPAVANRLQCLEERVTGADWIPGLYQVRSSFSGFAEICRRPAFGADRQRAVSAYCLDTAGWHGDPCFQP